MGLTSEQLEGARWSSAVICPRRACYEAREVEPSDDLPEYMEAIFWRSSVLGDAYQARYCEDHLGFEQEVEANWGMDPVTGGPIGTGHADLANNDLAKVVEVKVLANSKIPKHAFLQVVGYLRFLGYETAEIHSIDPTSGRVVITSVDVSTFMPEVESIVTTIQESLRMGTLPDRVCANPGAWQARACAFRTKCFLGWVGDDLEPLDPEFAAMEEMEPKKEELLEGIQGLSQEISDTTRHLKSLEGMRDHMRQQLNDLPRSRWIKFGDGWQVRITPVKGSSTLSVARMREAGWAIPEELQGFVSEGKGHERWTFKQS